jgi:anti-sigma B factor antagonist
MNITKTTEGSTLQIALQGRLDTATAPQLEQELKQSLDDAQALVFDLKELEYISSAGLRVLLSAHKAMMGKDGMTVRNANEDVMEIFDITGFVDVLNIEE